MSLRLSAAVDQFGDVLLWGRDVCGTSRVLPLLKGSDIQQIACTNDKIYALSRKGSIFVLPVNSNQLTHPNTKKQDYNWWRKLFGIRSLGAEVIPLQVESSANRRDRFVSIAAGDHHLLALTSSGKTYATPVDSKANTHGQLGVNAVEVSLTGGHSEVVQLDPVAITEFELDSYKRNQQNRAGASAQLQWITGHQSTSSDHMNLSSSDLVMPSTHREGIRDQDPRFCTTLYEIDSLKDLKAVEIACGSRHSLVRTETGEVYGFGANQFGQLGTGADSIFPAVLKPTQSDLSKSAASSATCIKVAAGGDSSYFLVEKLESSQGRKTFDLLAAGHGQHGNIGNGQFMHQASPTKVKTITGLSEWSEKDQKIVPIGIHTLSAGKTHVAAVLDNAISSEGKHFGKDLFLWGHNSDYQLGNKKRANLSVPQHIPPLPNYSGKIPQLDIQSGTESPMPHSRLQLSPKKKVGKHFAEEVVVTGWGNTGVYWRIVE